MMFESVETAGLTTKFAEILLTHLYLEAKGYMEIYRQITFPVLIFSYVKHF